MVVRPLTKKTAVPLLRSPCPTMPLGGGTYSDSTSQYILSASRQRSAAFLPQTTCLKNFLCVTVLGVQPVMKTVSAIGGRFVPTAGFVLLKVGQPFIPYPVCTTL